MCDFVSENEREIYIDLDNLSNSLIYKIPESNFTFKPELFWCE
jgi:hypothetical protein